MLVIYVPQAMIRPEELARAVVEVTKRTWKPVLGAWIGGVSVQKGREVLLQNNIPTYETPEEAIKTYLHMYKYKRNLELLYETPSELPIGDAPPKDDLKALIRTVVRQEGTQGSYYRRQCAEDGQEHRLRTHSRIEKGQGFWFNHSFRYGRNRY